MQKAANAKTSRKRPAIVSSTHEKQRTRYVWLKVLPDELWLKVPRGTTVSEALENTDIELDGDCGGLGKCGKCHARILTSLDSPTDEEVRLLSEDELSRGIRLACRTRIEQDMVIDVEELTPETDYVQVLDTGDRPLFQIAPLVEQCPITISAELQEEGLSHFDQVKLAMGPEYRNLKASLDVLRDLSRKLEETDARGAAILHDDSLLAWQEWGELGHHYGLVFDIGTTTLVGKLIDLADGTEIAAVSRINGQVRWGTDVISRIRYAQSHPHGLARLHNLLIANLNRIIRRLLEVSGFDPDDIVVAVAAGNTTMQHIFLKLPPHWIAMAPFAPVLTDGQVIKAAEISLNVHPEAPLYVLPMKAGYIGGDLISLILASGAAEQDDDIVLGMDLGTNAEIFIGNRRRLLTCSAAAGPALEGARISSGMIARTGAIEGVSFEDGEIHYRVIGNTKPVGICGSGLVDLVAVLLECGVINDEGLIRPPEEGVAGMLSTRVIRRYWGYDFLIASEDESYHGKPIYLTQNDVRELQMAKAAIAAGVQTLMDEMGTGIEDIHRVYMAGALGNYVHPYGALRIGLLPSVDPTIITSLGNATGTGASMVLLSKYFWERANQISEFIEHIELSSRIDFNDYFVSHMNFAT